MKGPIAMAVGERDWALVRTAFQRAVVSTTLIFVGFSVPVVLVSYWLFLLLGQSTHIAAAAAVCLAIALPGEISAIVHTLLNKTFIANHKVCSFGCSRLVEELRTDTFCTNEKICRVYFVTITLVNTFLKIELFSRIFQKQSRFHNTRIF